MTRQQFDELTAKGVVILDGATGSNLRKAGMPVGVSSEQWVIENPSVLQELQRAYVDAGSQIVYAPTFAANTISLRNFNLQDKVQELNTKLVKISKDGIGGRALVAGDLTTTGQLMEPRGVLTYTELYEAYKEQLKALIHLLNLIRVRFRPYIIFSGCIICCVYLRIHLLQFFRVIRSVTVTDRIRPPPFHQLQCLRYDIHISRNRYSARCTFFTHNTHLSLSLLSLSEPYQFRLYPIPNHKSPEITADNDLFPYLSLTAGSPIPVCIRQAAVSRPLH